MFIKDYPQCKFPIYIISENLQKVCFNKQLRVPHVDITYFKSRGKTFKVHSIRYSNFSISPQITNRYCASSCIKLISNITIEFYAFFIDTAHIESK